MSQIIKKGAEHPAIALVKQAGRMIQDILPKGVTPERQCGLLTQVFRENSKLVRCTPLSLVSCVVKASAMGFDIGRTAHLVPFGTECVLIVGYQGLIDAATRDGRVVSIRANTVYKGDVFTCELGTSPNIGHSPRWEDEEPTHYYAIARFKDGSEDFKVMPQKAIDKVRNQTQGYKKGGADNPWKTHPEAMALKTVIRRLCKYLPQTPELTEAMKIDTQAELGVKQVFDVTEGLERVAEQEGAMSPRCLDDLVPELPSQPKTTSKPPPVDRDVLASKRTGIATALLDLDTATQTKFLSNFQLKGIADLKEICDDELLTNMMAELKGL